MIFTDIKQAIGSRLLDVRNYSHYSDSWEVFIFDKGIIVNNFDNFGYDMGIVDIQKHMPEELKELIKQYK